MTPTTLTLRGGAALSPFRIAKLTESIKALGVDAKVRAEYWHIAEITSALTDGERDTLDRLLTYGEPAATLPTQEGIPFIITPRIGTFSPWSSKATEIAKKCGLNAIARLERIIVYSLDGDQNKITTQRQAIAELLHDRMTESCLNTLDDVQSLFQHIEPRSFVQIDLLQRGKEAVAEANRQMGLALSTNEIEYLSDYFTSQQRNPTDVELTMFAQANSEHCRHKIFNAQFVLGGDTQATSLFDMIRETHTAHPERTLLAYSDNAAVIEGVEASSANFYANADDKQYAYHAHPTHIVMKVETHNHPTAISPFPGAATGSGGEIRDEGATGRGAKPKAGLTGFSVSHLRIPEFTQPWEIVSPEQAAYGKPEHIASALQIMLEGPIGNASFNNEFGRANLAGYFRTFEQMHADQMYGYHKPIMLAGGIGNIVAEQIYKQPVVEGALLIQLGGPGMRIGLGGGAASSMPSGTNAATLDFDSVQRGNPEMERRAQEVIDRCWQMGEHNPILSIHDVGAGGLANAVPELVNQAACGAQIALRDIPLQDQQLSPQEIWCNEAQERYVLAILPENLTRFAAIAQREQCPYAVIGHATAKPQLVITDTHFDNTPAKMDLPALFETPPRTVRHADPVTRPTHVFNSSQYPLQEALYRVLHLPSVGDKTFLITIGDRSVGGMTARDQMVGRWQTPVADVAVTTTGFNTYRGEAMAIGERAPLAVINAAASGCMAVGEAITNIVAAHIQNLSDIKLSANWMAASGHPGEDANLFDTVRTVSRNICQQLGLSIPVGKDSLSMQTVWQDNGQQKSVTSPLSLVVSAVAPVQDVRDTLTPALVTDQGETDLILIDLSTGRCRLGGSAFSQVYQQMGQHAPDVVDVQSLKTFFNVIQTLNREKLLLAYHDRSDGGLIVTLLEMMFAGHVGATIDIDEMCYERRRREREHNEGLGINDPQDLHGRAMGVLFNEELGAIVQVKRTNTSRVMKTLLDSGLCSEIYVLGSPNKTDRLQIVQKGSAILNEPRTALQQAWSATSYRLQRLRDNPECADEEYARITDKQDTGLYAKLSFDIRDDITAPFIGTHSRPRIAVLREQGVNGHVEMAAAFDRAHFQAVDVHMSDLISGQIDLAAFQGFVACGGFSYGDVLGAGEGWAKTILFHSRTNDVLSAFFARPDTFALGVCNGCQMMSNLSALIPGAHAWPKFTRNRSEQFEARFVMVDIPTNPSIFLQGMAGSHLPAVVSHGEGFANYQQQGDQAQTHVAMRYIDHQGNPTERYPYNPNGSPAGITGATTADGRFTIMMPHPERTFRTVQNSWHPADWGEDSAWLRIFKNARKYVG